MGKGHQQQHVELDVYAALDTQAALMHTSRPCGVLYLASGASRVQAEAPVLPGQADDQEDIEMLT